MIYDIEQVLDTFIAHDNLIKLGTAQIEINIEDDVYDSIEHDLDNLDNDDPDFVATNMERGQIGEDYVEKIMKDLYGNCEKVPAKEGYDFDLFIDSCHIRLEVKTIQGFNAPFHITINEVEHAKDYKENYYICFAIINQKKIIKELRFLKNPIMNLKIKVPEKSNNGLCIVTPEKFMVDTIRGYIRALPNKII